MYFGFCYDESLSFINYRVGKSAPQASVVFNLRVCTVVRIESYLSVGSEQVWRDLYRFSITETTCHTAQLHTLRNAAQLSHIILVIARGRIYSWKSES